MCDDAPLAQLVERQSHNLKVASLSLHFFASLSFFLLPSRLRLHTILTHGCASAYNSYFHDVLSNRVRPALLQSGYWSVLLLARVQAGQEFSFELFHSTHCTSA